MAFEATSYIDVGDNFHSTDNALLAINNAGNVGGSYTSQRSVVIDGEPQTQSLDVGYMGTGTGSGTLTPVSNPGWNITQVTGISDNGISVGVATLSSGGPQFGYVDIGGTFTAIAGAGNLSSQLDGVNDLGVAVGSSTDSQGNEHPFQYNTVTGAETL